MRFRLVWYVTKEDKKYSAKDIHEYLGDVHVILCLWHVLKKELNYNHVEVYSIDGRKLEPEHGIHGMIDYNP